jgi:hypothetical protein
LRICGRTLRGCERLEFWPVECGANPHGQCHAALIPLPPNDT